MVRKVRDRSRKDADPKKAADAPSKGPAEEAPSGARIDEARLRLLLMMRLQGRTQKECAEVFGVDERTVRNWEQKLGGLASTLCEGLDPSATVDGSLLRFTAREDELLRWKREAEAEADRATMLKCSKELRLLERERFEFLRKLHLYQGFRFKPLSDEDASAGQADLLLRLTGEVFDGLAPDADDEEA